MTPIAYAPRPVLENSFDFRVVANKLEIPESLKPFFLQFSAYHIAEEVFSLMKSFPESFVNLGVHDVHLMDAVHEALSVCVTILPPSFTMPHETPNFAMGALIPEGAAHPIGYKIK